MSKSERTRIEAAALESRQVRDALRDAKNDEEEGEARSYFDAYINDPINSFQSFYEKNPMSESLKATINKYRIIAKLEGR